MLVKILESKITDRDKMSQIANLCVDSSDNNTAYLIGIDDVFFDMEEIKSEKMDFIENSATIPLSVKNETIIETESRKQRSIGTQISDFINKLF